MAQYGHPMSQYIAPQEREYWRNYCLSLLNKHFGHTKVAHKLPTVVSKIEEDAFKQCSDKNTYSALIQKKIENSKEGIMKVLHQPKAHAAVAPQQQHQQYQQHQQQQQQQQHMQHMQQQAPGYPPNPMQQQPQQPHQVPAPAPKVEPEGGMLTDAPSEVGFSDFLDVFVQPSGPGSQQQQHQQQMQQQQQLQQQQQMGQQQQLYGQQQQPGAYAPQGAPGAAVQRPQAGPAGQQMHAPGKGYPPAIGAAPMGAAAGRVPMPSPFMQQGAGAMTVEQPPAAGMYGANGAVQPVGGGMQGMGGAQVAGMMGTMPGVGMGMGVSGAGGMLQQQQPQQPQQQQYGHAHGGMQGMGQPVQYPYGVPGAQAGKDMAQPGYVQSMHQQQHAHAQAHAHAAAAAAQQQHQHQQMSRMPSGPSALPAPTAAAAASAAGARNASGMPMGSGATAAPPPQMGRPGTMPGMGVPGMPHMAGQQQQPYGGAMHNGMAAAVSAPPVQPAAASGGPDDATPAQVEEYWRVVRDIKARLPMLRQQIERYSKLADQQGPDGKAQRSKRILEEAMRRCLAERGSPEAAKFPINATNLRLVATVLVSLDGGNSRRQGQPQGQQPAQATPAAPAADAGSHAGTPVVPVVKQEPGAAAPGPQSTAPATAAPQQPLAAAVAAATAAGVSAATASRAAALVAAAQHKMRGGKPPTARPPQARPGAEGLSGAQGRTGHEAGSAGRDGESQAPGVDQVTRLLGLLSQPLPAAIIRAHTAAGAADALNFDGDSLMPALPPAACGELTAAAARATAAAAACGPPRARTVSVCRVAGMSYGDAGGDAAGGEKTRVGRQGSGEGSEGSPAAAAAVSRKPSIGGGAGAGAIGGTAAGSSRLSGFKRQAPDGCDDAAAAAARAIRAAHPALQRRRQSLEAACQAAEQELAGTVRVRLAESEPASLCGLEPDSWLLECVATVASAGEDGSGTGSEGGPGWKRLRVCVPWSYPDASPVPTFSSSDPSYGHPYGRAARLHFQTALQSSYAAPAPSIRLLARAWRDAVARVCGAVRGGDGDAAPVAAAAPAAAPAAAHAVAAH